MSNLSDLLDLVGESNLKSLSFVGSSLGVLADLSGAFGAIALVNGFLSDNSQIDGFQAEIKSTLENVLNKLDAIAGGDRWTRITNLWASVDDAFADANALLDQLPADVANLSALDYAERSARIYTCAHVVEKLKVPERWHLYIHDPAYYYDQWNGNMVPPEAEGPGSVFNDTYVMPQLIRALAVYVLLIRVLDSGNFAYHHKDIDGFRKFLIGMHHESSDGIRTMGYVDTSSFDDERSWTGEAIFNVKTSWDFGLTPAKYYDASVIYYQPFGAVHLYSGVSSFGKFPPSPPYGLDDQRFLVKLAFAARSRWKDVYQSVGLPVVWDCIELLGGLTGAPSLGRDAGRWWTLRELHSIVQKPEKTENGRQRAWLSDGAPLATAAPISATALVNQLYKLYGMPYRDAFTGRQLPLSLRALIERATIRDPVKSADLHFWWGP